MYYLCDCAVVWYRWLDKLGLAASFGVDVVIRQSFYRGHYALLDQLTLEPNPVGDQSKPVSESEHIQYIEYGCMQIYKLILVNVDLILIIIISVNGK